MFKYHINIPRVQIKIYSNRQRWPPVVGFLLDKHQAFFICFLYWFTKNNINTTNCFILSNSIICFFSSFFNDKVRYTKLLPDTAISLYITTLKVIPSSTLLHTSIFPLWAFTILLAIDNPSPYPPSFRTLDFSDL